MSVRDANFTSFCVRKREFVNKRLILGLVAVNPPAKSFTWKTPLFPKKFKSKDPTQEQSSRQDIDQIDIV